MEVQVLDHCSVCDSSQLEMADADCNLARCSACGYVFDNPRPSLEDLINFYSQPTQYDQWLTELGPRERVWKRRLRAIQGHKKPGSLLDVGAGIGQFPYVARKAYAGVFGTEVSTTAIKIARERYGLELFEGTVEDIAHEGRVFDNITMFHVLEHLPDPRSTLKTCHSLLSQDGILVIAVPNEISSLRALVRRIRVAMGMRRDGPLGTLGIPRLNLGPDTAEVHLSHFTPEVLGRLLRNTGFSVVRQSLDPFRLATGLRRVKPETYFCLCNLFLRLFNVNLYDTMLFIARKNS